MAEVVLGIGTSHTPMLFTPPDEWHEYESRDRSAELLDHQGRSRSYEELEASMSTSGPGSASLSEALTREGRARAFQTCQRALDRLARALEETAPDSVLVVGDDQKELFRDDNLPAILVYWGETLVNKRREPRPGEPSWWSRAVAQYYGREADEPCSVDSNLAVHLIETLVDRDFDVAQSRHLPDGQGEGHAFAFVHSRLLGHRAVPIVPVFLNTYYPPNQPTPSRCFHLGTAIRKAIESYPVEARIAVVGSGGLSHFVVDEELDRGFLAALARDDVDTVTSLPTVKLDSGTSEIRNWIAMYAASRHLAHRWTEYVPAYRTRAGTGTGCAFALWQ